MTSLKGKLYKIQIKTKDGQKQEYNMPYINSEPSEEEIIGFVDNFTSTLKGKVVEATWTFLREMTEREL